MVSSLMPSVLSGVLGGGPSGAGGGVLPDALGGIYAAASPDGHATRLLSAVGSLACESKLQGKIEDSDCSNYQLFRCPFWDVFYRSICRLKR